MAADSVALQVIPAASVDAVLGWVESLSPRGQPQRALKIKLRTPAQDGKANAALIRFLAREWGVKPATLSMVSGERARHKLLRITDASLLASLPTRYPDIKTSLDL